VSRKPHSIRSSLTEKEVDQFLAAVEAHRDRRFKQDWLHCEEKQSVELRLLKESFEYNRQLNLFEDI
jgi:hypothetical protein